MGICSTVSNRTMRIGLDARYVYDHFPGIGRYVVNLARALGDLNHDHTIVLLYNPALPNTRHNLEALRACRAIELVDTTSRPFTLSEQWRLPMLARTLHLDLFHTPYYIKPYFGMPCPVLVTIYDLIGRRWPQLLSWRTRLVFLFTTWLAIQTSARIITISASSRDDLAHYYNLSLERIAVTPLAADARFHPQTSPVVASIRATYRLPERYVLYVGANKPHKNLERLIGAWERLVMAGDAYSAGNIRLVIAGHHDPRYAHVQQMVSQRNLTATVLFIPNVDEADLPALYTGAEVFVFPSYYEGFGLPPLEAMACGVPVLCANTSSLPEVVGDAALMVDPANIDAIAAELRQLLEHASLRADLRGRGLQQASTFTWQRTAAQTLQAYRETYQRQT